MANTYKDTIKFKVSAFQAVKLEDQPIEGHSGEKNCIIYIQEGNCTIDALGKEHKAGQHMLIYIARGIKYSLRAEKKDRCLLQMVELSETDKDPYLDLRDLCAKNPAIFAFMGSKSRCCFLIDCENMYSTMNELFGELEADHPDKQQMIVAILTVLYIKMARSFRLHGKPSGVQYITEAKRYIAEHYSENLTVQLIADYLGISRSYLQILFKRYGKRSIVTHINGVRINKASYLLATTDISVLDIALSMGYNSRQHFTRAFHEHTGISPREYRKHHAAVKGSKN
jgi:AraC family transcriptional regulator, melibiose operon regulatory protein